MMRRIILLMLAAAMTAATLWFFATPQSIEALSVALFRIDLETLVIAFALSAAVQWLRAWRFAIMTRGELGLPDAMLVRIAFQLNFFNFVVPFRLGELSYPMQMRRAYGQPFLEAAGILILARLFDLATVGAILLAMAAVLGLAGRNSILLFLAASLLAAVPFLLIGLGRNSPLRAARQPGHGKYIGALAAGLHALHGRAAPLAAVALSFAVWLTFGILAIVIASAVSPRIGPAVALLGAAASNLAFALPVNGIGGLGPSQAAWVLAVMQAGVPWDDAVVSALALYAVSLASALLFGGLAVLTGRPGTFGRPTS